MYKLPVVVFLGIVPFWPYTKVIDDDSYFSRKHHNQWSLDDFRKIISNRDVPKENSILSRYKCSLNIILSNKYASNILNIQNASDIVVAQQPQTQHQQHKSQLQHQRHFLVIAILCFTQESSKGLLLKTAAEKLRKPELGGIDRAMVELCSSASERYIVLNSVDKRIDNFVLWVPNKKYSELTFYRCFSRLLDPLFMNTGILFGSGKAGCKSIKFHFEETKSYLMFMIPLTLIKGRLTCS
ncbi:hypothetical protein K501DRAFT_338744 [Backusella circina FSU 941]|nr:hypothetical protein K501DRAFT_338744 [Backusella circina FSU 941]